MSLWTWLANVWHHIWADVKGNAGKISIAITEDIQSALKSGSVDVIATIITGIFPNVKNVPQTIVADLKVWVPKVLASELALVGLPANATQDDITAFGNEIIKAFNLHDQKSKLYSTIAAQVYGLLQKYVGDTSKLTWADTIAIVETAYQYYLADSQITGDDTTN